MIGYIQVLTPHTIIIALDIVEQLLINICRWEQECPAAKSNYRQYGSDVSNEGARILKGPSKKSGCVVLSFNGWNKYKK